MDGLNSLFFSLTIIVSYLFRHLRFLVSNVSAVVLTKPKEREGITKYHVNRRVGLLYIHYPSSPQ